ncbi:MAG: nitroreductase family protein [Bacillota bacterium]
MNVLEAIRSRRSTRAFQPKPLAPEVITAIEEAILHCPSGSNAQESHFVIVQDPVQLRRIKRFAPGLGGEPAGLVVLCSNQTEALSRGGKDTAEVLRFVNLGIAASSILLTAHSLGVGTCPVRSFHRGAVKQLLGLPEDVDPELLITLGYPAQPPRPKTSKPATEVISHERYSR